MSAVQNLLNMASEIVQSDEFEQFRLDAADFISNRAGEQGASTQITQMTADLAEASEILNQSFSRRESNGQFTNVIAPVILPKDSRSYLWVGVVGFLTLIGLGGAFLSLWSVFGPHYWALLIAYGGFSAWRNSFVTVPDGCQGLIMRFGKIEDTVGAGRTWLWNPWKRVGYIVNTTKEYPYNAPIREAPTSGRVNASVDLFLQFRIEEPEQFIFTLGSVNGFQEKLHHAISEVTRALVYEQKAEDIYDLVGESTQSVIEALNSQFLPAVRFTNANITHAEPASQDYRMDLAAPEIVRVAKEAYTYEYELQLRKEQDEGDLTKELGGLHEELSAIKADIAKSQAQIDTAREKEINRANAYARQLMVEAESEARANAALLEAQALDIRAVGAAYFPEILEYRYQQDILDRLNSIADKLPQLVNIGGSKEIDFIEVAQQLMGIQDTQLYTPAQLEAIHKQLDEIKVRIRNRAATINQMVPEDHPTDIFAEAEDTTKAVESSGRPIVQLKKSSEEEEA
ncbi:MAG TPA: SPFH domain-containing protein [Anaerolineae bacterium]|nr:SPFH domain-containing protein [Anaerolineae bacterium]